MNIFLRSRIRILILLSIGLLGILFAFRSKPVFRDPLPSWNEGAAKNSILDFVHKTTEKSSAAFVPVEERIATFDQDGTLWVEHPLYSQLMYCLDRVPDMVKAKPELKEVEPFKSLVTEGRAAIGKLTMEDMQKIAAYALSGMSEDQFTIQVKAWLASSRDPRWKKPYTDLIYQPMLELMQYLRENGYKTYIVTGGGQDFVRAFSQQTYGVPPEQVVGTVGETSYVYDTATGSSSLVKIPKMLMNNDKSGKPEGIQLIIGRRPYAAFGNTSGDQQMLEYTTTGTGTRLGMLVLHDDSTREYAYGPAQGLPDSKVGTFSQDLFDLAKKRNWTVISMKNDWKTIFKP